MVHEVLSRPPSDARNIQRIYVLHRKKPYLSLSAPLSPYPHASHPLRGNWGVNFNSPYSIRYKPLGLPPIPLVRFNYMVPLPYTNDHIKAPFHATGIRRSRAPTTGRSYLEKATASIPSSSTTPHMAPSPLHDCPGRTHPAKLSIPTLVLSDTLIRHNLRTHGTDCHAPLVFGNLPIRPAYKWAHAVL